VRSRKLLDIHLKGRCGVKAETENVPAVWAICPWRNVVAPSEIVGAGRNAVAWNHLRRRRDWCSSKTIHTRSQFLMAQQQIFV